MRPRAVWLSGSRARGDHRAGSDRDRVVALPGDASDEALDPIPCWSIQREVGVPATILAADASERQESRRCPNTPDYDLAREGRRLDV